MEVIQDVGGTGIEDCEQKTSKHGGEIRRSLDKSNQERCKAI